MIDPLSHPFFKEFEIEALTSVHFDEKVLATNQQLTGVFFWGHNCPNCEIAKNSLYQDLKLLKEFKFKWFHVNVYENFDLGTRFGLHGIPAFIFFYNGKKLGRISPFPGSDPFFEALRGLKKYQEKK